MCRKKYIPLLYLVYPVFLRYASLCYPSLCFAHFITFDVILSDAMLYIPVVKPNQAVSGRILLENDKRKEKRESD